MAIVRLAWDRGVATGWTEHTETWSTTFGSNYVLNEHLELNGAVGLALLTEGEIDKAAQGRTNDATTGTGYAIFLRTGFRSRFENDDLATRLATACRSWLC